MRQPLEARSPAEALHAPREGDFAQSSHLSSTFSGTEGSHSGAEGLVVATFVYARLHHFSAICNAMGPEDASAFVNDVRRMLTDSITRLNGEVAARRPDSILAVFSNKPDEKPNHAQRGLHAAILLVHEAVQLANSISAKPQFSAMPVLTLAAGVHLGQAELSRRGSGPNGSKVHAIGDAVEVARLLEVTAMDLNWSVATSTGTRLASAGRADGGRIGSVGLPDNSFIDIVEVTGLVPRKGSKTPPRVFDMLRESLQLNHQARKRTASHAPAITPAPVAGMHFLIEGYRVLRKIGEGGMATIFLAQAADGGAPQVLKVMRLDGQDPDSLQRFIQEYALLAQIEHPNVARIFRQDFSVAHAYIAMEYFPQGDLRARMKAGPIDSATAISYIKQTAAGLAAIHAAGVVHRDMKPDNLMLRQDGSLALADFGVAKQVSMKITDTGDGDIVGTPYYLSPEQALGQPVDARCDIYSLGVLAYELLTGRKPYHASSAQELLRMHVQDPVPMLPLEHAQLQPVMESLMAKDREQRYPTAQTLLDDLAQMGL